MRAKPRSFWSASSLACGLFLAFLCGCSSTGEHIFVNSSGSTVLLLSYDGDKTVLLDKDQVVIGGGYFREKVLMIARGQKMAFQLPKVPEEFTEKNGPKTTAFFIISPDLKLLLAERIGKQIKSVEPQPEGYPVADGKTMVMAVKSTAQASVKIP